ncbi:MAG: tetratricopeptide repeat protein [Syntrophales bacterium LBB04]|nr:tetratricopeptide repeat protein [Syntrophales bacterium LBB04]
MGKKKKPPRPDKPSPEYSVSVWELNSPAFLSGILFLALLLRVAALKDLSGSIYFDFLLWDERIYHEWAKKIADGSFTSRAVYEFPPLFAYLAAGIYRLFSPDVLYIRILNIVFGVFTCWMVYLLGSAIADRRTGLLACLVAALYKPFIFYSIVPLKDTLAVALFALACYLSVIALKHDDLCGMPPLPAGPAGRIPLLFLKHRWACITASLGAAAGLLLNVRPNAVILIPVFALLILWYGRKSGTPLRKTLIGLLLYVLGLSLAVSPFVIRNIRVAGEFALTTSQAGYNLYLGNNLKNPDPYYRPVPFASSSPFEQGTQFTIEASRREGRKLSPREASSHWSREVLHAALAQPIDFAWKLAQKTLVLFNSFEACDHYDIDFISRFVPFFKFPLVSFWLILPLGMAGLIQRGIRNDRGRMLLTILFFYALTLIVFFTNGRYRLLIPVILIPFAALGVREIFSSLRNRQYRKTILSGGIIAVFLIIGLLPVRATDDKTAYYNTHAIILDSRGFGEEAIRYWKASSEMNRPYSAFANLSLAAKYYQRGKIPEGSFYLEKIPDDSFAAAAKYELTGDLMIHRKEVGKAIDAYERSLAINSGQRLPRMKIVRIYGVLDPPRAIKEEKTLSYIKSFYDLM